MGAGKVLLGVVAGAAAGALLGVLFAPDKGSVTRKKISQKGEDYLNGLRDKVSEFADGVNESITTAKERGKEMVDKGKAKFEETKTGSASADYPTGNKY